MVFHLEAPVFAVTITDPHMAAFIALHEAQEVPDYSRVANYSFSLYGVRLQLVQSQKSCVDAGLLSIMFGARA